MFLYDKVRNILFGDCSLASGDGNRLFDFSGENEPGDIKTINF